ncbi:MAG TPA: helicase-associated domain-containing protein, partial [Spirochaetota bacterium]|nr:helicase-associated domain-containing protein [Spirochaetota bacterium]
VLSIEKGLISLTDTGRKIAAKILKLVEQDTLEQEMEQKCIYINPDFSLMIPKQEIPSEDLYHILTHTEIAKDDIILNTKISKASILRAFKRGMAQEPFLTSLRRFSRNDIPQNLTFMLQEWAQQTIRVNIMNAIIIHSNQPSFLEELSYGKLGHAIIEKISPNYAVIDREHLDEVIKTAQDRDAVIRLFEEPE